jgi:serine/threonine protein kinase
MIAERYQLFERLGSGGFGVVHKALDAQSGRMVAVKIMTVIPEDEMQDQKARERFEREIRIAKSLNHPHILPALDSGYREYLGRKVPFLVSPYMPDGSLWNLIKSEPPCTHWSLSQTADVIMQAAQGIQYMHNLTPPKVHQDVKPQNFLISLKGNPPHRVAHLYLSDFGISREQVNSSLQVSEIVGTRIYMAPEQFTWRITCASDQYSLAIMACLLLTGQVPLQAPNLMAYMYAHLNTPPIPPSKLNPTRVSSAQIDHVILKALSKAPEQRFSSVLEFAKALEDAIMGQLARVSDPPAIAPTSVSSRQEPVMQAQSASIESRYLDIPLDSPSDDLLIVNEPLPMISPVAPPNRAVSRPLPTIPLKQVFNKELAARPTTLSWSPNGDYLACTFYEQAPLIMRRDGRTEVLPTLGPAHLVCWSPDGSVLAVGSKNQVQGGAQNEIHFWDMSARTAYPLVLRFGMSAIDGVDWSVHGQLAVWVEGQVLLYNLPKYALLLSQLPPQSLLTPKIHCGNIGVLRWSPDGSLLAAGANNGSIVCWRTDTQTVHWHEPACGRRIYSLSWFPDSSSLAVAFQNKLVVVWNVRERRRITSWVNLPAMPLMLDISPRHHLIVASTRHDLLFGHLHESSPSRKHPGRLLAAWSPTGSELVALDAQKETSLVLWEK